jgi:hypothetical protein
MDLSLTPVYSFERLDPRDVVSAIKTSSTRLSSTVVRIAPLGLGYEPFLKWAVQDIEAAGMSADPNDRIRFSVSAVMNARRSLSCLADQYLLRDGYTFCRGAPGDADKKAELLVRRGVFDSLAAVALKRSVERRNRVEHKYEEIGIDDARETVHVIRATIENCVSKSNPYMAPVFFGYYLGGYTYSFGTGTENTEKHSFYGWSDLVFILARCSPPPWFGIIVPSRGSKTEATLRKVWFSELSCDQLSEALAALEERTSDSLSVESERTFIARLACLGLS